MSEPRVPAAAGLRKRVVFVASFAFLALLTHDGVFWAGNDASRLAQIEALVDHGQTNIDASRYAWTVDRVTIDGREYSNKPPLFSLVGAAAYAVLSRGFGLSFAGDEAPVVYLLTLLLVGLPTAWLVACFDAALATARPAWRALATLSLATGTVLTSFAVTFGNHPLGAALLFAACRAAWSGRGRAAGAWAGLLLCVDIAPGLVFLPVLAAIVHLAAGRRGLARYVAAAALGGVLFVGVDWAVLGSPLPPKLVPGAVDHSSDFGPSSGGVRINVPFHLLPESWWHPVSCLFGWHGFLSVSPVLLFGVVGMARSVRGGGPVPRGVALCLAGGCAALTAGHALFVHSFGGWSYGYRYLIPIVPVLLFFVPRALEWTRAGPFVLALGISALFALAGAYHPWPPVAEPEAASADASPASQVSNPVGANAAAWLRAYFPGRPLTRRMLEVFVSPDPRTRRQYLRLFYQSRGAPVRAGG